PAQLRSRRSALLASRLAPRYHVSETESQFVLETRPLNPPIPLEMLQPGEIALVDEVCGLPADILRLQELGLRTGQTVEMVQAGSPCIIRVAGQKLCFRQGEVFSVLVRVGGKG